MSRNAHLVVLLSLLVLIVAAAGAPGLPFARAQDGGPRVGEAVELGGEQLAPLQGAPWDQLWVYAWVDGDWAFIAGQLDERDSTGQFVASEDNALDENDVYVFMADGLGQPMPAEAWPPNVGHQYPALEVRVSDPLRPGQDGYAYVFRSDQAPYPRVAPRVRYDETTRELTSDGYTLGFADPDAAQDGFVGLKRLSLQGAQRNLLDRLKIRVQATIGGTTSVLTEEELAVFGGAQLTTQPVKAGLVRVVLDPTGASLAYDRRVTLYGELSGLEGVRPPIPGFELGAVRVSLDLASGLGEVRYSDANLPAGVLVDGQPDEVPASPLPAWRQVAVAEGRAVLLRADASQESAAAVYYKDDATQDADDTGDYRSYGDNGVRGERVEDYLSAGFPGELVALAPDAAITAADLAAQAANPLVVTVTVGELPPTPTPGPATPTPEHTPSPTPPVAGPTLHVYLPFAWH